jgi:hypothetical protein
MSRLHKATVASIPRDWRDQSQSEVTTTRGAFPKVWLRFAKGSLVPWPTEDVFTNVEAARTAVARSSPSSSPV